MRFRIDLKIDIASQRVLPINYQYELSSAIYKCMSRSDADYTAWLHDNGFTDSVPPGKRFKLFCFSNFRIPRFSIDNDRLRLECDRVALYLSFLPEQSTAAFVKGAFADQVLEVGDRISKVSFRVTDITILPPLSEMAKIDAAGVAEGVFRTLSPVCVSRKNQQTGRADYLSPVDSQMGEYLMRNLREKYKFYYGEEYAGKTDFEFELLSEPRRKGITIKRFSPQETKVIGYGYRFRLRCDPGLMDIAGDCGLGEKGSIGFGFIG